MRVIRLGALCDLNMKWTHERQVSFDVSEFAVLDNGERVILHSERGFSGSSSTGDPWDHVTVHSIERDVLTTVLPDDDDTDDDHPWEWLIGLLLAHGVEETRAELREVPYEVVLTDRVLQRVPSDE